MSRPNTEIGLHAQSTISTFLLRLIGQRSKLVMPSLSTGNISELERGRCLSSAVSIQVEIQGFLAVPALASGLMSTRPSLDREIRGTAWQGGLTEHIGFCLRWHRLLALLTESDVRCRTDCAALTILDSRETG